MARDRSLDALRGLAITLVVIGHSITVSAAVFEPLPGYVSLGGNAWVPIRTAQDLLLSVIYSFHMPLMAFVSGLVMWPTRSHSLGVEIVRRAKALLVPYAAWAVVMLVALKNVGPPSEASPGSVLVDAALGRGGGLWYLYALFVCLVLLAALVRLPGRRWTLSLTAVIAAVASSGVLAPVPNTLYLTGGVLWIYPFVVLGYAVAARREAFIRQRWRWLAAGLVVYAPLFALRYPVFANDGDTALRVAASLTFPGGGILAAVMDAVLYRLNLLPYLCAIGAVFALYALYAGREGALVNAQAHIGTRSLGIYALSSIGVWWGAAAGLRDAVSLSLAVLAACTAATAALERMPGFGAVLLGHSTRSRKTAGRAGLPLPVVRTPAVVPVEVTAVERGDERGDGAEWLE